MFEAQQQQMDDDNFPLDDDDDDELDDEELAAELAEQPAPLPQASAAPQKMPALGRSKSMNPDKIRRNTLIQTHQKLV